MTLMTDESQKLPLEFKLRLDAAHARPPKQFSSAFTQRSDTVKTLEKARRALPFTPGFFVDGRRNLANDQT